jgi:hypothetical protein
MLLQGGTTYQFSFWLKSPFYVDSQTQDTTSEKFEVMFGNAPVADSLTTVIYRNESLRMADYTQISQQVTPTTTGKYHVGFHTYSEPLQWLVIIDDVSMSISQGIEETLSNTDFSIYPNPAHGMFTINCKSDIEQSTFVKITNAIGQEIASIPITANHQSVDVSNYPKGLYYVSVLNGKSISTTKIIVQ